MNNVKKYHKSLLSTTGLELKKVNKCPQEVAGSKNKTKKYNNNKTK